MEAPNLHSTSAQPPAHIERFLSQFSPTQATRTMPSLPMSGRRASQSRSSGMELGAEGLTGWAGIERHMAKYDTAMVQDYADDIDTLLVFAGLFSAILTAFVIETYTLLQPQTQDTTSQLLAYSISSQPRTTPVPSSINNTINTLLMASPSSPSISARWINVLFFLSLVLSIASAFFGIIAKQWLREYLQWNSPLGDPRDNVLVRQLHFEAWEAWNVAATITSIPALLEVAMVLFLIGIVILLWTLDSIVAIVVTIAIAAFIGAAAAFIVLPVFSKRCPYKSPTAWALVTAHAIISASFIYAFQLYHRFRNLYLMRLDRDPIWRVLTKAFLTTHWQGRPNTWRERSVGSCTITTAKVDGETKTYKELLRAVMDELKRNTHDFILKEIEHSGAQTISLEGPDTLDSLLSYTAEGLLNNLAQSTLLLRALSWAQKSSQDQLIRAYVNQCLDSVQPDTLPVHSPWIPYPVNSIQTRNIVNRCICLAALNGDEALSPSAFFTDPRLFRWSDLCGSGLTTFRRCLGVYYPEDSPWGTYRVAINENTEQYIGGAIGTGGAFNPLVFEMLAADFARSMKELPTSQFQDPAQLRVVVESFRVLVALAWWSEREYQDHFVNVLHAILRDRGADFKREFERRLPGLRAAAFAQACICARVTADVESNSLEISEGRMSIADYTLLMVEYFDIDFMTCGEDDVYAFAFAAQLWLFELRWNLEDCDADTIRRVFSRMACALECLARRVTPVAAHEESQEVRTGGSSPRIHVDVSWPLAVKARWTRYAESGNYRPEHCRLLHAFDKANAAGLITPHKELYNSPFPDSFPHARGPNSAAFIKHHLHNCLMAAHAGLQHCDEDGCSWLSHVCDAACSLPPGTHLPPTAPPAAPSVIVPLPATYYSSDRTSNAPLGRRSLWPRHHLTRASNVFNRFSPSDNVIIDEEKAPHSREEPHEPPPETQTFPTG